MLSFVTAVVKKQGNFLLGKSVLKNNNSVLFCLKKKRIICTYILLKVCVHGEGGIKCERKENCFSFFYIMILLIFPPLKVDCYIFFFYLLVVNRKQLIITITKETAYSYNHLLPGLL